MVVSLQPLLAQAIDWPTGGAVLAAVLVVVGVVWLVARRRREAAVASVEDPTVAAAGETGPEKDEAGALGVAPPDEDEVLCSISSDDVMRALKTAYRKGARLHFDESSDDMLPAAHEEPAEERAPSPAVDLDALEELSEDSVSMSA